MVNYDMARQESLKNKNRAFLMHWVEAEELSYWSIINYCSNLGQWSVMLSIPRTTNKTYCVVANGIIMAWREPLPVCTNWGEIEVLEDLEDGVGQSYFPDQNIQSLLDRKYITKIRFAPQHWVCHITERGKEYLRYCHANMFDGS